MTRHPPKSPLFPYPTLFRSVDPPEPNGAAVWLAERYGLSPVFETARMYRGARPELPLSRTFGISTLDRKSTRLNSSHANISYAVFCLKKKKTEIKLRTYLAC